MLQSPDSPPLPPSSSSGSRSTESEYGSTKYGFAAGWRRPPRRPPQPERPQQPLLDVLAKRRARDPRHHEPEQRVGEIRVVPGGVAGEHLLRLAEPREQLLLTGEDERLPDLARRLALEPRRVSQHPAQRRRPVLDLGQVLLEPVVEVELPLGAQLHDRGRGERLRDRRDRMLGVDRRRPSLLHVREPDRRRPRELAGAKHPGQEARQPALALRGSDEAVEPLLRPGQARRARAGSARPPARCPRRRCPGG